MKRILMPAVMAFTLFAVNANAQITQAKPASNKSSAAPYDVANKNITMGNQAYAQKVLWAWRYFQDNTIDKMKDLFADDVVAGFPNGSTIKGRDNIIAAMQKYRDGLASVQSEVDACITLNSDAHPEDQVVSIWGTDVATDKEGKTEKTHFNEIWFFNKEGKVFQVYQMAAKDAGEQ